MAKRWYGNVVNRIEEGRTIPEIKEGTDITMYYWSDRTCYYVTKVVDQKHIEVKQYNVVADHSKELGRGHQEWLYFKTRKEMADYMKQYYPNNEYNTDEPDPETWVYRYNHWNRAYTYTKEDLDEKDIMGLPMRGHFNEKEIEKLENGGTITRYYKLDNGISFGRRDYYYDWEF